MGLLSAILHSVKNAGQPAYFHATTRTVNGEVRFDRNSKERLRQILWKSARFCEVRLLSYCIMDNHFHVLVRIDPEPELSVEQLIAKVEAFYTQPHEAYRCKTIVKALRSENEKAGPTYDQFRARMGDLSAFMKTVKQHYSRWYNREFMRFGTLYESKYKAVLLEGGISGCLQTVAAYITLNPIRSGLVKRPDEYRYTSWAEALAGQEEAIAGLREITGQTQNNEAMAIFRQTIEGGGAGQARTQGSGAIPGGEAVAKVMRVGGQVSSTEALRCNLRFMSDGFILGREEFVQAQLDRMRAEGYPISDGFAPWRLNVAPEWGPLATPLRMRGRIYGEV